jgi:hypothetical protein
MMPTKHAIYAYFTLVYCATEFNKKTLKTKKKVLLYIIIKLPLISKQSSKSQNFLCL